MSIENAISKNPDATWVLLNPLLEDSETFGLAPPPPTASFSLATLFDPYVLCFLFFYTIVCYGNACACGWVGVGVDVGVGVGVCVSERRYP